MKHALETTYHIIADHKIETILLASVLVYAAAFSHFTYLKHYTFSSFAWDLGVFNQVLHDTAFEGKPFYYTPDLYFNGSGSYLVMHFSPILFTLLPIYYILPGVLTLLRIKALLLASAAIPLYLLSNKVLEDKKVSLIIALTYLLYPGLQGANWFDFQQQAFLPLLLFATLYFFVEERWSGYAITLALTLMTLELSFAIIIVSLLCLLVYIRPRELLDKLKQFQPNRVHVAILTALFGTIYYTVVKGFMSGYPINPLFRQQYLASSVFNVIQYNGNTVLLPIYVVTHLGDVIQALSYDPVLKLLYIVFLFGPLLFLPLTSRSMAPILLLLAPFLLSNYQAYYMIGSHYSLYLIAPIFVALIMVYKHNLGGERRRLAGNMLLVTIFFSALLSPVSGVINSNDPILWYPPPTVVTDRVNALHGLIGEVPESVSILTQNHIFPHFSDRINAYVIPELPASADQEAYLRNYIDELMTRSDYILLDLRTYDAATAYVFEKALREGSGHRIALYEDSAVLITREEGPSVTISDSYPRTYTVNSGLSVGKGAITTDPTSESTEVAESTPGSRSGHLVFGPYEFMDRGTYTITLALKNPTRFEGYLGTFDVYDSGDVITKRNVYGYEFEPGDWTTAKITLTLRQAKAAIEYRFEANDQTSVLIDYVKVELAQGPAPGDSTRSIDARDLTTASSRVTPDGLIVSNANGPQPVDAAWFGPYLTLPPGNYTVTYQLKPVKLTQAAGPTILYADIATGNGKKTLAGRWITLEDMRELRAGWYSTAFDLRLGEETELEFRGGEIQPGWSVSLSQIIVEPDG